MYIELAKLNPTKFEPSYFGATYPNPNAYKTTPYL